MWYLFAGTKFEYVQDFRGPRVERSCTDVICLLIFIVVLGGWGCIGQYGKRQEIELHIGYIIHLITQRFPDLQHTDTVT